MTSVHGFVHDGFHQRAAPNGHQQNNNNNNNFYQSNNFGQHQYHPSFSAYQAQPVYPGPGSVYHHQQPVAPARQAYNANAFNSGYYGVPVPQPAPVEAPAAGSLNPVLDYDIKIMSKFMTYLAFRISGRKDTDNERFIANLEAILTAVRLPLSSLILANYYLIKKYEKESFCFQDLNSDGIKQIVVLCLVLANKANDDNSFTNKSWQEATGLHRLVINKLEVEWLNLFGWRLHDVNMQTYNELYAQFTKYSKNINAHEEQKKWEQQLQAQYNYYYSQQAGPVCPSHNACVSPIEHNSGRFNAYQPPGPNWQSERNNYGYQPSFDPQSSKYSHSRGSSMHYTDVDCCVKTGSYQKSKYCLCQYCSTGAKVDWSYNIATAY